MTEEKSDEMLFQSTSKSDLLFDNIVGALEDILVDGEFEALRDEFFAKYASEFEDAEEENKHSHYGIFQEYIKVVERYIDAQLKQRVKNFDMAEFLTMLKKRPDEVMGDVFEMLQSFSDFTTFKELMVEYAQSHAEAFEVLVNPLDTMQLKSLAHSASFTSNDSDMRSASTTSTSSLQHSATFAPSTVNSSIPSLSASSESSLTSSSSSQFGLKPSSSLP